MRNKDGDICRILLIDGEEVFFIRCLEKGKKMPEWKDISFFDDFYECDEYELEKKCNIKLAKGDELSTKDRLIAHNRYSLIQPILVFVEDERKRIEAIKKISNDNGISEQTIRSYIQTYLIAQSIYSLVPYRRNTPKEMTTNEKNFRWAINKYYYSRKKNSLHYAYIKMLSQKYSNNDGELVEDIPTYNQFRYWYAKNKKMLTYYISRDGLSDFMRNNRVLLGDNVQVFANAPGVGMVDSTILDIYLVDDSRTQVIGRPIFNALVDAFSGLCLGFNIGWEGGEYSLRELMCNVLRTTKVLPGKIVTDRGSDYAGTTYAQLVELGVNITNLEGYRPDKKGPIEKFFDIIQNYIKPELKGFGIVAPEYLQRGAYFSNYKKASCITLDEITRIIGKAVEHYNNSHIIQGYPYSKDMIDKNVKPYAMDIWKYGIDYLPCNIIEGITRERLILTLLPRVKGRFTRYGLKVNKMRYFRNGYIEHCLKGGIVDVAYDKDNASYVWLYEDNEYVKFELLESRYKNLDLIQIEEMKRRQNEIISLEERKELQSEIELYKSIDVIRQNALSPIVPSTKNMVDAIRNEKIEKKNIHSMELIEDDDD